MEARYVAVTPRPRGRAGIRTPVRLPVYVLAGRRITALPPFPWIGSTITAKTTIVPATIREYTSTLAIVLEMTVVATTVVIFVLDRQWVEILPYYGVAPLA